MIHNDLKPFVWGGLGEKTSNNGTQWFNLNRVYDTWTVSPAIETSFAPWFGGRKDFMESKKNETTNEQPKRKLRIRKLTEGECYRLMGFEEKDTEACKAVGQSKANIYHQAGDSIVTTVLVGIFGELQGYDYEKAINEYVDRLHNECV
jgi:site-specific DNA-cytosine methylase